jgi:hypothetical protein
MPLTRLQRVLIQSSTTCSTQFVTSSASTAQNNLRCSVCTKTFGQETKVIPTIPRTQLSARKFKDTETGIEYALTNEEVNAMLEVLGKERSKAMAELIKEDWYKSYPDEDKAYELEYLYKEISKNGEWKQLLYNFMEKAKQENRVKE